MKIKYNIPIARSGGHLYRHSEVFGREKQDLIMVYRDEKDLKNIPSLSGIGIFDSHDKTEHKGEILSSWFDEKSKTINANLLFFKNNIDSRELSLGYDAEIFVKDGKIYQRNLDIDHLALVKNGRCGKICKIK